MFGKNVLRTLSALVLIAGLVLSTVSVSAQVGWNNGDVINIGYDIYVWSDGQFHHVPNPETLDAMGISRTSINNY